MSIIPLKQFKKEKRRERIQQFNLQLLLRPTSQGPGAFGKFARLACGIQSSNQPLWACFLYLGEQHALEWGGGQAVRKARSGPFRSRVGSAVVIWGWGEIGQIIAMPRTPAEGWAFSAEEVSINLLWLQSSVTVAVGTNCPNNPAYNPEPAVPHSLHSLSQSRGYHCLDITQPPRAQKRHAWSFRFPGAQGERWCSFELELGMTGVLLALSCWLYHRKGLQERWGWQPSHSTCMTRKDTATAPFNGKKKP